MSVEHVAAYLAKLAHLRKQAEATPELSLREPLLALLRELAKQAGRSRLLIAPEADAEQAGQPDIFVKDGPRLVGFIETKAPGTDLGKWLRHTKQGARYRESLPNWVATDYYRFIFVRDGNAVARIEVADASGTAQPSEPDSPEQLQQEFTSFFAYAPPIIRSPQRLALELSRRARLLRDGIRGALQVEPEDGRLRSIHTFYRQTLMSDLDEENFADTFAQTIAYGLFLARLRESEGEFTLSVATAAIPQSVPFLRSTVRLLTDEDVLPGPITRLLDDLVALLDNTKIDNIRKEVAAGGLERDLVVYFYERFLEQYDAGERKKRGVYYTPPELVGYLVRTTEEILERDFGLPKGFAEDTVTVLDPAVGTGTFLLGAAERAIQVEARGGSATRRKLIRDHLLKHFYGFELLPAPYAIAHLKLSTFFESQGYDFKPAERIRVYLTNSLEPHEIVDGGQLTFLPMVSGIVQEARAASEIKERVPVLVILGNPPYERTSHNNIEHSNELLEDFYRIDGSRLPDRNTGPLRDDYLRFIRWGVWKLLEQEGAQGHGILAFVTNRAYLERKLHRAVRNFLLRSFDEIYIFDLHGDQREWFADRVDEKVFKEVQAGIALSVFVKRPAAADTRKTCQPSLATVHYRESFGRRAEKYAACREVEIADGGWEELKPHAPLWLFVPYDVQPDYDFWPSMTELFPVNVVGFQTHRDQLVVAFSEDELRERLARFADPQVPDSYWEEHGVKTGADFSLPEARKQLADEGPRRVMRITYRGLERRWITFDERLIDRTRTKVSPHLLERNDNLALVFATGSLADGPYVAVARTPVPAAALSWRTFGAAYFAPLWLHNPVGDSWEPNLAHGLLERLAEHGIKTEPDGFANYVYAIVNAPAYRGRYADALRYDFARVPITDDAKLFEQVRALGADLTAIHLLEHPKLMAAAPAMNGNDQAVLAPPVYDETRLTLHLAPTLTAEPITPEAWRYQQGSYPVLREFLDARVDRPLTSEEFNDFRALAAAVQLTLDCLPKIDALIPKVGDSALTAKELLGENTV